MSREAVPTMCFVLNADEVLIEVFREPVPVQTRAAVRLIHKPTGIMG
jgi:hypothetical protein